MSEQEERREDFGLGSYEDLLNMVDSIVASIMPEHDFQLEGDQNQNRLLLKFNFESSDVFGLFLGSRLQNLKMLQRFVRVQQIYPHNRYIKVVITNGAKDDEDEEGEDAIEQEFVDTRVHNRMKKKEQDG